MTLSELGEKDDINDRHCLHRILLVKLFHGIALKSIKEKSVGQTDLIIVLLNSNPRSLCASILLS